MHPPPGPTASRSSSTSISTRRRSAIASTRTPTPSLAEIRTVGQPAELFERHSAEHWAGRLYMRRLSPYVTRLLLRTPVSANAVTGSMAVLGLAAGALLSVHGIL